MKNNQLIVNNRETGKTTYLFNEIVRLVREGSNIIVLDSATEHEDKSLLKKVMNSFDNAVSIDIR